jgi:hypothetical protein
MSAPPETPTYVHPEDFDLDAVNWDLDEIPELAQDLADEIRWLRGQRSQLAAALAFIANGGGVDAAIAAVALAEVGGVEVATSTAGTSGGDV